MSSTALVDAKLTPKQNELDHSNRQILNMVSQGISLREACETVGTTHSAFIGRTINNPALEKAYAEARLAKTKINDAIFSEAKERLLNKAVSTHEDLFNDSNGKVKLGATRLAYQLSDKLPRAGIVINQQINTANPPDWPIITVESVDTTSKPPESDY